jgi:hypothetical protein
MDVIVGGLPWWVIVISSSLAIRGATYPLRWATSRQLQKLEPAKLQVNTIIGCSG